MTIMSEMPPVGGCTATSCAYNVNHGCHAKAITVGDDSNPRCDTFLFAQSHSRDARRTAGVGACKVTVCAHNDDFECTADEVRVGSVSGTVRCETFVHR